jgi:hypothetical protein
LIPFVDEEEVIANEKALYDAGLKLSDADRTRNSIAFEYWSYKYDAKCKTQPPKVLKSTLTNFTDTIYDLTTTKLVSEYAEVGKLSFEPELLKGVVHPSPGYPSFKYLGIQELEPDHKVVQKVSFIQQLVVMPQCIEETQPQELQNFLNKLVSASNKELYCGFPFQQECFAMYFEDKFNIFTVFGDVESNVFTLQKDK